MCIYPLSLIEAEKLLTQNGVQNITQSDLLNFGTSGHLLIGTLLSFVDARSIKKQAEKEDMAMAEKERIFGMYPPEIAQKRWYRNPMSDSNWAYENAYVSLSGFYVLPPKTLLDIKLNGASRTGIVHGHDGEIFFVCRDVTIDQLTILPSQIHELIRRHNLYKSKSSEMRTAKPKVLDKRLGALKKWLVDNKHRTNEDDSLVILPKHYTLEKVYGELCKTESGDLFKSIELNSFDSHFWAKQKLVELMRGNKSTIL